MNPQIKRINSSEASLVTDLFDKYRVFYKKSPDIALAEAFIQARLDNNESVIFVATVEENGQIVPAGFTQLYPRYSSVRAIKIWLLNDLYVEPQYRKFGIGESLIQTALKFAKDDKASFVELSTAVDNYTAQSLYEAIGFERQGVDSEFYDYRIEVG